MDPKKSIVYEVTGGTVDLSGLPKCLVEREIN